MALLSKARGLQSRVPTGKMNGAPEKQERVLDYPVVVFTCSQRGNVMGAPVPFLR